MKSKYILAFVSFAMTSSAFAQEKQLPEITSEYLSSFNTNGIEYSYPKVEVFMRLKKISEPMAVSVVFSICNSQRKIAWDRDLIQEVDVINDKETQGYTYQISGLDCSSLSSLPGDHDVERLRSRMTPWNPTTKAGSHK
ncbi:hypothetical protein [Serratia liquefaciens]|uniref:START domain-containing protein n=1 Tax=Serratia liquefaciens TaxID=614 RepID=A0A515CWX0_SERLI|nr:hypothetical protein [Serratia liquefaciens]QDL32610.1 hypothetical protein EGO53_12765 [Serratia liquefaciens]